MNIGQGAGPPTEVLSLMNMITPDELEDEEEYEGNIWSTSICRYISTFSTCTLKLSIGNKKKHNLKSFCNE
jgi:hypothetical protein